MYSMHPETAFLAQDATWHNGRNYRYAFFRFSPGDLAPSYWINMGAMAISTLAGSLLIVNAPHAPYLLAALAFPAPARQTDLTVRPPLCQIRARISHATSLLT